MGLLLRGVRAADRPRMAADAVQAVAVPDAGATAFVQMLGHKADLMVVLFRPSFEGLAAAQLLRRARASERHLLLTATFAALAAVEDSHKTDRRFSCVYVGLTPWHKDYGVEPTFQVRRRFH